jgi:hypothetical protein
MSILCGAEIIDGVIVAVTVVFLALSLRLRFRKEACRGRGMKKRAQARKSMRRAMMEVIEAGSQSRDDGVPIVELVVGADVVFRIVYVLPYGKV